MPRRSWWRAAAMVKALVWLLLCTGSAQATEPSTPRYGMQLREASITSPDGVHLAADIYSPTGAAPGEKFPVLLEYLPYRKTEARGRNWSLYSYFVQRGY